MAQGSPATIASDLERDDQLDEFLLRSASQQDELSTACHSPSPSVLQIDDSNQLPIQEPRATPNTTRTCRFRKSTRWLIIIALVLFVLLVVGGGVMGSRIEKNRSSDSGRKNCLNVPAYTPTDPSATWSASSSSPSRTSVQFPIQSLVQPLQQPSDDCGAVQPQYTPPYSVQELPLNIQKVFDVYCKINAVDGDFMSFYSPSLTTCIDGCAAYNTWQITNSLPRALNCSGVTYTIRMGKWGNCFLKQAGNVLRMSESAACTYAKLRTP